MGQILHGSATASGPENGCEMEETDFRRRYSDGAENAAFDSIVY